MFHQPQHQADSLRAAFGKICPVGAHAISDEFETSREVFRIFFELMLQRGYVGQVPVPGCPGERPHRPD